MTVTRFQQKRGSSAQWAATNPVLRDGELGIDKDTGVVKIGDGVKVWSDLEPFMGSQYLPLHGKADDATRLDGLLPTDFIMFSERYMFLEAEATAVDSEKLGGIDPTGYLKTSDAASFLPATGKAVDADKLDGNDSTYFAAATDLAALTALTAQTSATRKLVTNWGAMTSFPVSNALPGDTVVRSDIGTGGSSWLYVGPGKGSGGWVHKGLLTCTSTTRPTSVAYSGLQILETDTGFVMMHNGTVWRYAGPALYGTKTLTLGTTTPAISGLTLGTTASIVVPPNSRIWCEAKVQLDLANTNYQTMGWGKPWGVTSGSTVLYSTYEHMVNNPAGGNQLEFNFWSRALIDTGTNSSIVITAQWTSGGGNNAMTLSQPEFFYQIGGSAP